MSEETRIPVDGPYYDKRGMEIRENDLIKIFHFIHYRRRKKTYMYHVVTLKQNQGKWYFSAREYYKKDDGHYWLKAVADKNNVLRNCEIIAQYDWENELKYEREAKMRRAELNLNLNCNDQKKEP